LKSIYPVCRHSDGNPGPLPENMSRLWRTG
jgi:hypothetical protein